MAVRLRRVASGDAHMDQKFLVLEGYIEGLPQLTKRVTVNTAALADGSVTLDAVKSKLTADVEEYRDRLRAVEAALMEL